MMEYMNTSKTCQFEGCSLANITRGYCGKHYRQLSRSGELKKLKPEEMNQDKRRGEYKDCSICLKKIYKTTGEIKRSVGGKVYCSVSCWYKRNKNLKCIIEDCDRSRKGRGYCLKHYRRWWRYGNPLTVLIEPSWSPNIKRYRKVKRNGINYMEHRWNAEQILGRKLTPQETIHHIDGNKLNNNPENLILFKTMSEHRQYENRYREYLEKCLREGILKFVKTPPAFDGGGTKLKSPG